MARPARLFLPLWLLIPTKPEVQTMANYREADI